MSARDFLLVSVFGARSIGCGSPDEGVGGASTTSLGLAVGSSSTGYFATSATAASAVHSATISGGHFSCPTEPAHGQDCTLTGACAYGTTQCTCSDGAIWLCVECPTSPVTGAACPSLGATCGYGFLTCNCTEAGWDCGTCPDQAPDDGDVCEKTGLGCTYGEGDDYVCGCDADTLGNLLWECAGSCPTNAPLPGDPCLGNPDDVCDYPDVSCVCVESQFFCN